MSIERERLPGIRAAAEADGLQRRLLEAAGALSPRLRELAERMLARPEDVAGATLRQVAARWQVPPASLSRLARALGHDHYEALREDCRREVALRERVFAIRARAAQSEKRGRGQRTPGPLQRHVQAAIANAAALPARIEEAEVRQAAVRLVRAQRVVLVGALSSAALIDYLAYMGTLVFGHWLVAGRGGSPLAAGIAELGKRDLVMLVSTRPYAQATVDAARQAASAGVPLLVLTDQPTAPVADLADQVFCLPTEGPHFLSSHVATLILFEALIAAAMSLRGDSALAHVERLERAYHEAGVYWRGR
ncbi:MAG: MurR/RpiR family transcriptional regulator [Burkholderiaceae bacterium]